MVAGYKVHGPLLWGLSVGIMDCSIHWMAVESRESLLLLRFLQLMCLFAFCICLFCWKGARHCCFYIFTTNVHFPGQEESTMFSQQIKLAFCRAVCKSSLFIQRSQWTISSRSSYISPYKAFQAMHNFKVKLLQPCLHLYTTPLAIIFEVMGAVKRPVNFVGIKRLTFVRVLRWHKTC